MPQLPKHNYYERQSAPAPWTPGLKKEGGSRQFGLSFTTNIIESGFKYREVSGLLKYKVVGIRIQGGWYCFQLRFKRTFGR